MTEPDTLSHPVASSWRGSFRNWISRISSNSLLLDKRSRTGLGLLALLCAAAFLLVGPSQPGVAQQVSQAEPAQTLFQNVRIFDGKNGTLSAPSNVLVGGNTIQRISPSPITPEQGTRVIDGGGRVLMPGLIDNHWHATLVRLTPAQLMTNDPSYSNLVAAAEATATLMRGFTTVRDLGGPVFPLKRAIDEGLVAGPRIYPSGAVITVTSGHGDFRQHIDLPRRPGHLSHGEELGGFAIADSPDEVRMRVREQLMQGASQIKLTAGGGVASPFSPLDAVTFTEEELRAAVEAAENWGTYVCTHSYTSESVQRSIRAGVKCIEHGHLMDDATAKMIADKGIWLSTQPFVDMGAGAGLGPAELAKLAQVVEGTNTAYTLARKYNIKVAFGTDILFSAALAARQGHYLVDMGRWFTPAETLIMATSTNGELLRLSGLRNPYPGALGVVEQGAYADLLLVEGNPLEDINIVADPDRNFLVIMKDGKIYKNML